MSTTQLSKYWFIARSTDQSVPSAASAAVQYKRLVRGTEYVGILSIEEALDKLIQQNKVHAATKSSLKYEWKLLPFTTEDECDLRMIACLLEVDTCTRLLLCLVYICPLGLKWERLQKILRAGNVLKEGKASAFVWEMAWISKLYEYGFIAKFVDLVQSTSEGKAFFYGVLNSRYHLETIMNFLVYAEEEKKRNNNYRLFADKMKQWINVNGQTVSSEESDTEEEQNLTALKQHLTSITNTKASKKRELDQNDNENQAIKQLKIIEIIPEDTQAYFIR